MAGCFLCHLDEYLHIVTIQPGWRWKSSQLKLEDDRRHLLCPYDLCHLDSTPCGVGDIALCVLCLHSDVC